MIYLYVYLYGNKITHAEISTSEILSEGYYCLYSGEEKNVPNLFPKGIKTDNGGFNYALVDGKVVERSSEEVLADELAANPPKSEPGTGDDSSVWDELDAAYQAGYQEGVESV